MGRHFRQNLVGYVALFFAVGGGLAYAGAAKIGGEDIKPDSINVSHLNLPVGMYDTVDWEEKNEFGTGDFQPAATNEFAVKDAGGDLFVTGTLETENRNPGAYQEVMTRIITTGPWVSRSDPLTFDLAPGQTELAPITFTQKDIPTGDYRLSVEVKTGSDVKVKGGGLVVGVLP